MVKKKIASMLTTAALLISFTLSAYASTSLTDIEGSYAKDAIQDLVNKGIINGKGDGNFDPTGKIERQDFAIILAKALNLDISSAPATATFSDVPTTHYAYKYVEAAAKAGLIKGVGNGEFGSGANLSRQDMAVLFVRALGVDAAGKASEFKFNDAASIADYAKDSVAAAVELGLITGNSDGTFNPSGNAERQAVALVSSKFLKAQDEISPKIDTLTQVDNRTVTVTFTKELLELSPEDFVLIDENGNVITIENVNLSEDKKSVTIKVENLPSEGKIRVEYKKNKTSNGSFKEIETEKINPSSPSGSGSGRGGGSSDSNDDNDNTPVNRSPLVVSEFTDQELTIGNIEYVEIDDHFSDPDGDVLSYSVASDNVEIVTSALYSENGLNKIKLTPLNQGTAIIAITANDEKNGRVSTAFRVNVGFPQPVNRSPQVVSEFADRELNVGNIVYVEIDNHFTDPDGDELSYSVVSDDEETVTAEVYSENGLNKIKLTPLNQGTATISVTANDEKNGIVSTEFIVYVGFPQPVNHDPIFIGDEITEQIITIGERVLIAPHLDFLFSDKDEDDLTYEIISSDEDVVYGYDDGGFYIRGEGAGTALVTVTAYDGNGGEVSISFNVIVHPIPNQAPTATDVGISGTPQLGQTLYGVYTYIDIENDTQGISTFKWFRADDATGTNKVAIDGATSSEYTLTDEDIGKYISFEVTPLASTGTLEGTPEESNPVGPIMPAFSKSPLDLINAASESGIWDGVDVITFANAGVTGVTYENLFNVKYYLMDPDITTQSPLPRTLDKIQAIVNAMIQNMMVEAIYDYLRHYGDRPTVEVFAGAGITGVDASNLDAILDELDLAYQESVDPFGSGTPMSTKQDIQDVVDRFPN
ncbi:S-layer homology domain-containing protein [Ammoniphilus resinae]|uniref:SLH domain-containing protein n=1 Tax=Ammoniphilus resinae TaxID=861532 RepID=A0ABS4GWZ9_9BACL|nr:S-layer homology domain-containing protein [Ammoniphilus resinae]MBP1934808.1 hypothetical protein [Ammoniphilus resinae]